MTESEVRRWFALRARFRNGGSTAGERREYARLERKRARLAKAAAAVRGGRR
jgi:hypothetical protein